MKVEIWSDVICPWCGLGQHRLNLAAADFTGVEIIHRSFQLDPRAPAQPRPVRDMLRAKYRMTDAQLAEQFTRIEGLAAADGLSPYIVGDNQVGNTHLAHELLAMASQRGHEAAAWAHLYRAYFGEARSIFDLDALVTLGAELGLDADEVRAALTDRRYRDRVDRDGLEAQQLGATGVPFVVIDRRLAIAGAESTDTFRKALERAQRAA